MENLRAFAYKDCDYFRLTRDLGKLEKGAIFVHDKDDTVYGSISNGCLKLCYTIEGNCYTYVGGSVIFHYDFVNTDLFEPIPRTVDNILSEFKPNYHYEFDVDESGNIVDMRVKNCSN